MTPPGWSCLNDTFSSRRVNKDEGDHSAGEISLLENGKDSTVLSAPWLGNRLVCFLAFLVC